MNENYINRNVTFHPMSNSEFDRSHLSEIARQLFKWYTWPFKMYLYAFSGLMFIYKFIDIYVIWYCLKIRGLCSAEYGAINVKIWCTIWHCMQDLKCSWTMLVTTIFIMKEEKLVISLSSHFRNLNGNICHDYLKVIMVNKTILIVTYLWVFWSTIAPPNQKCMSRVN